MKERVSLIVLVLLALCFLSYGQMQVLNQVGSGNSVLKESNYVNVQGSPYFTDSWNNGLIVDNAGKVTENLLVRYDMYRDEIQFLKDGKTLAVEPALASGFTFWIVNYKDGKAEKYVYRNGFFLNGYSKLSYFQVVYDGKIKFLRKTKVNYLEELVSNYGTNEQVKKFVRVTNEFLVVGNKLVEVAKNRKNILPELNSDELRIFVKSEKLNIKNEEDLMKILYKAESLIKIEPN